MVEKTSVERALDLDNVRAGYGETVVLEDIRLAIGPNETVSIIGRNGVGKTTLLATIMGHTTLHGGRVSLHGNDLSARATYRRVHAGLGYVPQEREIFPSLTLRENLEVARAAGTLDHRDSVRAVSAPWRARRQSRQSALRRRTADAGDRPRADRKSDRAVDG